MLTQKKCTSCEGATELSLGQIKEMLPQVEGWGLSADNKWLEKRWKFKNFVLAQEFVNRAAGVAELENHHPDISLGWGYAHIRVQTHAIDGLHENDFILAAKINEIQ